MDITAQTRLFALIGHPVRHSLSPNMYNALFPRFGINAIYVALDVHPDNSDTVAQAIRTLDLVGANLTVPFKEHVLPHLDHRTVAAEEAGAANVVVNIDGELTGYNTDGEGLMRSLEVQAGGYDFQGISGIVVGTGGTGRAVASALLDRGATRLTLLNRTVERAEHAALALMDGHPDAELHVGPLTADEFARHSAGTQLVINCTSGDGAPRVKALDASRLAPGTTWVDVNYWMDAPPHSELGRSAKGDKAHLRYHTGHAMLAHQGALAFELFTGHAGQADEILARLIADAPRFEGGG